MVLKVLIIALIFIGFVFLFGARLFGKIGGFVIDVIMKPFSLAEDEPVEEDKNNQSEIGEENK